MSASGTAPETSPVAPLILVCEDEPALRRDVADELREAGYRVIEAADGAEVIARLSCCTPDLLLCDIMMPGIDGYGVLAEFRRDHPHLAHVPLIFLSALAMSEAVVRGKRAGADDYLTKPIDYDLLLSTIEARLRQSRRARRSTAPVAGIGRHMLDHLFVGVLAYDARCRLIHANAAARGFLGMGPRDKATPHDGVLAGPVRRLAECARAGREETLSVRLDEDGARIALAFSCPASGEAAGEEAPAVLVYVTDSGRRAPLSTTALSDLFSLTPTEAQVARHLATGLRPDDIAAELGVSQTTIAFHMRNVFAKTATNRQADLVALLLSLPVRAGG